MLGPLMGCQADEAARPPIAREPAATPDEGAEQAADYETWQPSYSNVGPATADDVQDIRQRVAGLNESAYAVTVPLLGVEIASAPEHVRVRFAAGSPDGFDVHLDPTLASDELFGGPFVMCSADDGSCVEIGGEGADSVGPHLVNNGVDTIVFTSTNIVGNQRALPGRLIEDSDAPESIATVASPSGALDCLVSGGTPEEHARLEGSRVDLQADPLHRVGGPVPLSTTCVDENGLVVLLLPSLMTPVVPYGAFTWGAPDGFDDHADPLPLGSAPSTIPSEAPATPDDPDQMQSVLVAAAPIGAGESLDDAQRSGRFELEFIPGGHVLPGAVSSTDGLDGVALENLAAGEQITDDSFGPPR